MEKPVKTVLPADLPENWQLRNVISPNGTESGLTEKHGYNYLMKQINDTHKAVNAINEAFEDINDNGGSSDVAWYPNIDSSGTLSWDKTQTETPPEAVNVRGKDGVSPTISIAGTVTAESGTPASVINVGTPQNVQLQFTIPKGTAGDGSGSGEQQTGESIPVGVIVMWSGAINAIPNGWALCNGTNNTGLVLISGTTAVCR